jgi:DNA-binding response OmpR family regulator
MKKILIADDNEQITTVLADYARKEGYEPLKAYNGSEAMAQFKANQKDIVVVLLDVMMPEKDGFQVCREIREFSMVPIILVTARGEDFEKIMGLDIGADDYIVKPFSTAEVMARVRAVSRRFVQIDKKEEDNAFKCDNLTINLELFEVKINEVPIALTKKEVELLYTLAKNKKKVFTRDNLLESLWGYDYEGDNRTVDSHIKRLRAKLSVVPHDNWSIKTIWGVGYRFEENESGE